MTAIATAPVAPETFLQVVGHRLRWRLLGELARCDRTVQELTESLGEPQSLVSYHLGKLRTIGVVAGRRSSADRRDTYYTADLPKISGLLSTTGAALHPGLRLMRPPRPATVPTRRPARVLFLCTGNSARSQIAEALVRGRAGGAVEAFSAGSHPKALHPNAERVLLEEFGIDMAGQRSKHLRTYLRRRFDCVVTLCDRVREVCPDFPGRPTAIHWSIPDPAADQPPGDDDASYPAFRHLAHELDTRIGFLLAALSPQEDP